MQEINVNVKLDLNCYFSTLNHSLEDILKVKNCVYLYRFPIENKYYIGETAKTIDERLHNNWASGYNRKTQPLIDKYFNTPNMEIYVLAHDENYTPEIRQYYEGIFTDKLKPIVGKENILSSVGRLPSLHEAARRGGLACQEKKRNLGIKNFPMDPERAREISAQNGKNIVKKRQEQGLNAFGLTKEECAEICRENTKKGLQTKMSQGLDAYGLTPEEHREVARKGGLKVKEIRAEKGLNAFNQTPEQHAASSAKGRQINQDKNKKLGLDAYGLTPERHREISQKSGSNNMKNKFNRIVVNIINSGHHGLITEEIWDANRIRYTPKFSTKEILLPQLYNNGEGYKNCTPEILKEYFDYPSENN